MKKEKNEQIDFKLDLSCMAYVPTLNRVLQFYKHRGLVGEERVALLQTLLAIKKSHFGLESLSGSGKSITIDILLNYKKYGKKILLPVEDVYIMGMSSKTAQSYKAERINKAKIIYVEELQKAGNSLEVIEMLKNLAEGKDSTRDVRDQANRANTQFKIKGNKGIVYTLAIENQHKNDAEMKRRFTVLTTDVSKEQTQAVIRRKSSERFAKSRLKTMETDEMDNLRSHLAECIDLENVTFENPFAEFICGFVPTPDQKVRSFIDHYFDVIEACALFHHKERVRFDRITPKKRLVKPHIFINLEDVILAHLLYSDFFNKDVHSVPPLGLELIKIFDRSEKFKPEIKSTLTTFTGETRANIWFTISEIHDILKTHFNIVLPHKITKETLNALYDAGYLMRRSGTGSSEFAQADKIPDFNNAINWKECTKHGIEQMKKHYPKYYDEWMSSNLNKDYVYTNPFTGKQMKLEEIEHIRSASVKDKMSTNDKLEAEIVDFIKKETPTYTALVTKYPTEILNWMVSKDNPSIQFSESGDVELC